MSLLQNKIKRLEKDREMYLKEIEEISSDLKVEKDYYKEKLLKQRLEETHKVLEVVNKLLRE